MKLLAPNGKPSNLTPEQYALVRTTVFKKWFGDWESAYETGNYDNVSKVIDEETKEPLVVYHGTFRKFNIFSISKEGGFFFQPYKRVADIYAEYVREGKLFNADRAIGNPRVLNCFLNITKIKKETIYGIVEKNKSRITQAKKKFNGLLLVGGQDVGGIYDQYVAFYPEQIKLADGTNTTFDSKNPDIRFAGGGKIKNIFSLNNPEYKDAFLDRGDEDKETWEDYGKKSIKFIIDEIKELKFPLTIYRGVKEKYSENPSEFVENRSWTTDIYVAKRFSGGLGSVVSKIIGSDDIDYESTIKKRILYSSQDEYEIILNEKGEKIKPKVIQESKFYNGGELTLTSEQVENKLGRKLHWWNDDVVTINGTEYKKVFLRPEYKIEHQNYEFGGIIIENPSTEYNEIFVNGVKVGYLILSPAVKEYYWIDINLPNPLAIVDIKIFKEFRGKNYMKETMNWLFNFAKEKGHNSLFLRVDDDSEISQETLLKIYENFGFSQYRTDDDDIFMYKLLK